MCQNNKKIRILIKQDVDPLNPRTEMDTAATFAFFHARYVLGDKDHGIRDEDFSGWDAMEEHIVKMFNPMYITRVYMYDHSGITISSSPFGCLWDSGRIGFAWITREQMAACGFKVKRQTPALLAKARDLVEAELKHYDQYLRGDVYGYVIQEQCGECGNWHHTDDSCWGFFGDDIKKNGIYDHVKDLIEAGAEVIHG